MRTIQVLNEASRQQFLSGTFIGLLGEGKKVEAGDHKAL